jgi:hypothetical protein
MRSIRCFSPTSVLSNFELRVPHLAIPSVESCTGSARHGDFWQLKPLNGSLSQWHTTPNSNLDEALGAGGDQHAFSRIATTAGCLSFRSTVTA